MNSGNALATVEGWFFAILAFFAGIFGVIEGALRQLLNQLGVGRDLQSIVILVVMVLFIVAVLRLFGGVFRILILVFLILLALHILVPNLGF